MLINQPNYYKLYAYQSGLAELFEKINTNRFEKLNSVVRMIGGGYKRHFHFSKPTKDDTWQRVLSDCVKCLQMINTCENYRHTLDRDDYKITCDTGLFTKLTTVRFNYFQFEYKINVTISSDFPGGNWNCVPSGLTDYYEKQFIELVTDMKYDLPVGRTKEILEYIVRNSQP